MRSSIAIEAATAAGCVFGRLMMPVPSLICLVAAASQAIGDKGDAGGDILGPVGDVLADIGFGEAQFIGEQEGFAIFPKRYTPILINGMDRHRKEPELHGQLFPYGGLFVGTKRASFVPR
jgi:hypothetical protein